MQITRQADYAIRAVRHLAGLEPGKLAATSLVAREQSIPPSFLAKIISQLTIAGLLTTSRGAQGGVGLKRSSKEISLLDVVEAIDGPIYLNTCVADSDLCCFESDCPLKPIWSDAQADLVKRLRETKFDSFGNGHKN